MDKKTTKRKTRREYGSGSISINNKLQRYTVTWTDNEGKKHSNSQFKLTPAGKKEAQKFLEEINGLKKDGIDITEQAPLYEWLAQFLVSKKNTIKRTTLERYKNSMLMIPESLLEKPINDITETDLRTTYNNLTKKYKASTIHELHSVLLETFEMATRERKLRYNTMRNVKRPRKKKKEITIYTPREAGKIFRYIRKKLRKRKETCLLLFRLIAVTGMRIGEALALEWDDIDLDKEEIHVHKTLWQDGTIEETKTEAGDRFIPIITKRTIEILKKEKSKNREHIFEYKGEQLKYQTAQYDWNKIKRETGINKRLHDWRHTFASYMLAKGVNIPDLSRILGHTNPYVTLQIYAHSTPNSNQNIIRIFRNN